MFIEKKGIKSVLFAIALVGVLICGQTLAAAPREFETPQAATDEFISALTADDNAKLEAIFGINPAKFFPHMRNTGKKLDEKIQGFLKKYSKKHTFENEGNETILCVGKNNWPFFIPLLKTPSGGFYFDVAEGKEELRIRRIGKNELFALKVIDAYGDAQREFYRLNYAKSPLKVYAKKILSDKGQFNGLHWHKKAGTPDSPLGPYLAWAERNNAKRGTINKPYSGYYFKILTKQGKNAPGGTLNYIEDDMMVHGHGLIAWPARYGKSGIMSFMVSKDGIIYEKDLGEDTEAAVYEIDSFNPDDSWVK